MRWHHIAGIHHEQRSPSATILSGAAAGDASARGVIEAGTIKPSGPLDADQLRNRSKRQARVQQQIRDEESRHVAKKRDLNARLIRRD
jgi:hypothetical protein